MIKQLLSSGNEKLAELGSSFTNGSELNNEGHKKGFFNSILKSVRGFGQPEGDISSSDENLKENKENGQNRSPSLLYNDKVKPTDSPKNQERVLDSINSTEESVNTEKASSENGKVYNSGTSAKKPALTVSVVKTGSISESGSEIVNNANSETISELEGKGQINDQSSEKYISGKIVSISGETGKNVNEEVPQSESTKEINQRILLNKGSLKELKDSDIQQSISSKEGDSKDISGSVEPVNMQLKTEFVDETGKREQAENTEKFNVKGAQKNQQPDVIQSGKDSQTVPVEMEGQEASKNRNIHNQQIKANTDRELVGESGKQVKSEGTERINVKGAQKNQQPDVIQSGKDSQTIPVDMEGQQASKNRNIHNEQIRAKTGRELVDVTGKQVKVEEIEGFNVKDAHNIQQPDVIQSENTARTIPVEMEDKQNMSSVREGASAPESQTQGSSKNITHLNEQVKAKNDTKFIDDNGKLVTAENRESSDIEESRKKQQIGFTQNTSSAIKDFSRSGEVVTEKIQIKNDTNRLRSASGTEKVENIDNGEGAPRNSSLTQTEKALQGVTELNQGIQSQNVEEIRFKRFREHYSSAGRLEMDNERLDPLTQGNGSKSSNSFSSQSDTPHNFIQSKLGKNKDAMISAEQEMMLKEYLKESIEVNDKKDASGAMFSRMGEMPISNIALRRTILPSLTQAVQKTVSAVKEMPEAWQKHSFELEDGNNIQLSTRKIDGVLQVKMLSSSMELSRLMQQYEQEIKQHLEQECQIDVDLQFDGNDQGQDMSASFGDSSSSGKGRLATGDIQANGSSTDKSKKILEQSIRRFGYNQMEWTA